MQIIVICSNTLHGSWSLHLRRLLSLWKGNHAVGQKVILLCGFTSINFKNSQVLYTVYYFLHIENKIWECTGKVVHCSDRRAVTWSQIILRKLKQPVKPSSFCLFAWWGAFRDVCFKWLKINFLMCIFFNCHIKLECHF